ncbi:CrcB family protein [Sphingoaurantiacus capsulatus]|uniref:Fluoride-specific ion channel FluC n=1 Tax=Sphingoaurantiacus capsulatus TaxID=1771310 RepID=A0ABV7X7T2_9SPHN
MSPLLLVMAGGAVGAGARFLFGIAAADAMGAAFPWGTWGVNIVGGFLMGLLFAFVPDSSSTWRLFIGVGILGGFTTFSAFSLELFDMVARGEAVLGAAYAVSSVAGSVIALLVGVSLGKVLA